MLVRSYLILQEENSASLTEKDTLRVRVMDFRIRHSVTLTKVSSHSSCHVCQQKDWTTLINKALLKLGKMTQAKSPGCGLIYAQHSVISIPSHPEFKTII